MPILQETNRFQPEQKRGIPFLAGIFIVLLLAAVAFFYLSSLQTGGILFVVFIALGLALCLPLPLLAYRAYACWGAYYQLQRDGLRLRWGLRIEDIPISKIEWIRPISDLVEPLPLPPLSSPGAILGSRRVKELGEIEFLASERSKILLLATPEKIFAISPADPGGFIQTFYRLTELGSLTDYPESSVYPVLLISTVWVDKIARSLVLPGFGLWLAVIFWTILIITSRPEIALGYDPSGTPVPKTPVIQLVLLPIVNGFAFLIDLAAGFYLYRRDPQRPVAYLVWAAACVTSILLLIGLFFITLQ